MFNWPIIQATINIDQYWIQQLSHHVINLKANHADDSKPNV